MDGSGKTTLAKKVAVHLKKQGIKSQFIHAHAYRVSQNSFGLRPKAVRNLKYLFRLLLPFAFFDNLFTYCFRYKPILKDRTLICDRYFYDKLARMVYYGIAGQFLAKIYLKLLPKPDFVFFLDLAPEKIYQRKKEYAKRDLQTFRKIYKFLAKVLETKMINTRLPLDTSIKKIIKALND